MTQTPLQEAAQSIAHQKSFAKLFGIPCPVPELLPHYVGMLVRSPEYRWLEALVPQYAEWSRLLGGETRGPLDELRTRLIARLRASKALARLRETTIPSGPSSSMDAMDRHAGRWLVELDQVAANYSALREFDPDRELPDWDDLVEQAGGPRFLGQSKALRQFVLGNVEVKRLEAAECALTAETRDALLETGMVGEDSGLSFARLMPDEIVIALPPNQVRSHALIRAGECMDIAARLIFRTGRMHMRWRVQIWYLTKLPFLASGNYKHVGEYNGVCWRYHDEICGVPGSQYYVAFRKTILGEPPHPDDARFVHEGMPARWELPREKSPMSDPPPLPGTAAGRPPGLLL